MTFPVLSASTPSTGYKLTRSLRFRSSASAYLNRTPATATNRTTWTWSGWVKRGTVGVAQIIFQANGLSGTTDNDRFLFYFNATGQLSVDGALSVFRLTNAVFRDPSAWYHIVLTVDTGNATTNNRILLYVNGVSQSFSTNYALSSGQILAVNGIYPHYFSYFNGSLYFVDGYLAEVNFVDGQALTPSSFGSTNSTTGVWQPAAYTGTYGTNGFYLPFTDNSALTTASNAGLGKDFSGNANYWVTNNISITAGATYDSMTDVPTLTSATAGNFCVMNPLFVSQTTIASSSTGNSPTLSNGNLTVTAATSSVQTSSIGTFGVTTDKFYCEYTPTAVNSTGDLFGFIQTFGGGNSYNGYRSTGVIYNQGAATTGFATWTTSDVIGMALDCGAGTLACYKNNTLISTITITGGVTAPMFPIVWFRDASGAGSVNFGQRPFTYTPPSGFVALNTYNLPASTVSNGAAYMAATLYTGTLLSNTIANTVGSASFQPDFVWIKSRSAATDNKLTDSVRGVTKGLISNTTAAETTDTQGLTAFGSTGFTVGTNTDYNNLSATYVAWQWNAGGSTVTNTNGSISSQVRANTTAGFSVVTYTGVTSTNVTVGHGLGVAPNMIIVKSRSLVTGWYTYHVSLPNTQFLALNTTQAATNGGDVWNSTTPTSSVFYLSTNGNVNQNATFVAYCFAAIKGFSAFGSYTGNGVADGPFTYTGFRPRWVMIKRSDTANDGWYIVDSSRSPYNQTINALRANASDAESSESVGDFLSNGFKIRIGANGNFNASGGTYIYAAFAESPFQNSLAR